MSKQSVGHERRDLPGFSELARELLKVFFFSLRAVERIVLGGSDLVRDVERSGEGEEHPLSPLP